MLPWGHAAVGYLWYAGAERARGSRPTARATAAVLVGSQLPDLIDKPLAWTVSLLPNGRSLAHSLVSGSLIVLVLVGLLAAVGVVRLGWPLAVGALSHSLADALHPLVYGDYPSLAFLAWPVLPPVEYDATERILAHLLGFDPLAPWVLLQTGLVFAALLAWWTDGRPGWAEVRQCFDRRFGGSGE